MHGAAKPHFFPKAPIKTPLLSARPTWNLSASWERKKTPELTFAIPRQLHLQPATTSSADTSSLPTERISPRNTTLRPPHLDLTEIFVKHGLCKLSLCLHSQPSQLARVVVCLCRSRSLCIRALSFLQLHLLHDGIGLLTMLAQQQRPHSFNPPAYLPNGAAGGHPGLPPGAAPLLPNNGRIIQQGGVRVLCVADVRGEMRPEIAFWSREANLHQETLDLSTS